MSYLISQDPPVNLFDAVMAWREAAKACQSQQEPETEFGPTLEEVEEAHAYAAEDYEEWCDWNEEQAWRENDYE